MIPIKLNQFKLIYKHLLISILLVIIYVTMSFLLVNDMRRTYYLIPIILFICVVWLIWNTYPTNRVASTLFIVFITVFLYSNFLYNTTLTLHEFFINASHVVSLDYLKPRSCQLTANLTSSEKYNIFFVESNFDTKFIRPRQLCAIESAAFHNPKANVYIMSINARLKDESMLLNEYKNIMWMSLKPDEIFSSTPLWKWWSSKRVLKSQFKTAHLSDALRLALLWKYGGIYSDLDTITIKSFLPLLNFSGAGFLNGKEPSLGNGFLHFRIGHPFLYLIMEKFAQDYNPDIWGYNGPILLRQTMAKYCQVDNIYKSLILNTNNYDLKTNDTDFYVMNSSNTNNLNLLYQSNSSIKCDLVVYPQQFFYPYNNYQLSYLFNQNAQLNVSAFMNTYSVHFYGKVSSRYKVKLKESSVYEYLASNNCEFVYKDFKLGLFSL